jgi:1,4-alpha-glucan branching enzyme
VYSNFEGVQTIAEESTSFPMVSRPTSVGGVWDEMDDGLDA